MLAILNITAPIFMIMAMGYFSVRFNLFDREQLAGMGKFVLKIGLPMLVFHAIATKPLAEVIRPAYLAGYALASVLSFFAGWAVSKLRGQNGIQASLNGLGTGMSNTGFIGYPLLAMAIGSAAGVYFAMNVLVENLLILPLMLAMIDAAQGGADWRSLAVRIVKNLLKNPMIIAMIIGLVFAMLSIPVPVVIDKVTNMLATASSPLALFVIGGGLFGLLLRGNMLDILVIAAGKLLQFPLLVVVCLWLLGCSKDVLFAGAVLASVPMASMYPIFGLQYGYEKQASAAMLATTILSFFSVSLVLFMGR